MKKHILKTTVLLCSLIASQAQASLVLNSYGNVATPETVGGYEMTDFEFLEPGGLTSSILSPISGSLSFNTKLYANSDDSTITHDLEAGLASTDLGMGLDWWKSTEAFDYNVYTTTNHWIEIILPENTLAFSFNIGANTGASGWLTATDSNWSGLSNVNNGVANFSVNPTYSPGFGIYADNSNATAGNCSYVSSVIIDPDFVWGVGNFSIAQGDCATAVPEPSILALMSFGLIGVGLIRRKVKAK